MSPKPLRQALAHLNAVRALDFSRAQPQVSTVNPEDPHILVVDDHREIRESLAQFLRKHGRRATPAGNAEAARAAIKQQRIDLVILDIMIEEMGVLTEQALSLARAGASDEARVSVDLAEIARTLCGEFADMGVAISAETTAPVMAACRPSEIARALRNLAENAVKHGGGGFMRVSRNGSGEAVVDVIDDVPASAKQCWRESPSRFSAPTQRAARAMAPASASPSRKRSPRRSAGD